MEEKKMTDKSVTQQRWDECWTINCVTEPLQFHLPYLKLKAKLIDSKGASARFLGSLSKEAFKRSMSTGSGLFAFLGSGFVQIFR